MDLTEGVGWIHVAQDRDQWRALVSTVMNLRVNSGEFLDYKDSALWSWLVDNHFVPLAVQHIKYYILIDAQ
jgi:hypothetical protein